MSREEGRCVDCGCVLTEQGEGFYMVQNEVWSAAGMEPTGGQLCIGCLEKRLGRTLLPEDFTDAPANGSGWWASERLVSRTGYRDPTRMNRIMRIFEATLQAPEGER